MTFAANPLALSVPEPAFEAWLRDSGYLEILDDRTSATADPSPPPSSLPSSSSLPLPNRTAAAAAAVTIKPSIFASFFSFLRTLISLFTLNPFAKLEADDFSNETPSWTLGFVGPADSYSWPAGPSQARMRVQENVRRYARNYAYLALLFLACSLYQFPVSLLGLVSSVGLWELVRFCSEKWQLEETFPGLRQVLVRLVQFAIAAVLYSCNLQKALICAMIVSYIVMILHASLRKLAPSRQSIGSNRHKRVQHKRVLLTAK